MTSFMNSIRTFQGSVRSMMVPTSSSSSTQRPFSADYSDDTDDLLGDDDGGGGGTSGGNIRIGLGCGASAPPPLLQMSRQDCISPCSVKFFWGRIPRETAIAALTAKGLKQGLFILREKTDHLRNFALSVVHIGRVHHYIVERCSNGMVRVPRGKTFPGPVELIQHHQKHQDGFLCKLTTPCERPMGESPLVFKNFTVKDLEEAVSREATRLNLSGAALLKNLGPQRATFENSVVKRLHEDMAWYHHVISRQEAEERMSAFGHADGLFLVRVSVQEANKKSTALSISFEGSCRHYRVSADVRDRVSIEKSSKFNSIMELIDHYYYNQDGLLHRLTTPCLAPGTKPAPNKRISSTFPASFVPTSAAAGNSPGATAASPSPPPPPPLNGHPALSSSSSSSSSPASSDPPTPLPRRFPPPPIPSFSPNSTTTTTTTTTVTTPRTPRTLPPTPMIDSSAPPPPPPRPSLIQHQLIAEEGREATNLFSSSSSASASASAAAAAEHHDLGLQDIWDEPPDDLPPPLLLDSSSSSSSSPVSAAAAAADDHFDPDTYGEVPKTLFKLNRQEIMLQNAIGTGNFGAVLKGVWLHGQTNIPVAVKSLKAPESTSSSAMSAASAAAIDDEILKEAETMKHLEHPSVIKMLGVCVDGDPYMLILEFAPLGPMHKFLRKNKTFPIPFILDLMLQVAEGMAYLEANSLVHRDLAARNILLVNEKTAKISDFGLSKALGKEQDYYRAGTAGRWPLKWYAPEAIYYWKFDSRTDVWSFGVTLWEATSYGAPPYKGMKGEEIISLIEAGQRLEQPAKCPNSVFNVLLKCWTYTPKARPTFGEVVLMMQEMVMLHGGGGGGGAGDFAVH